MIKCYQLSAFIICSYLTYLKSMLQTPTIGFWIPPKRTSCGHNHHKNGVSYPNNSSKAWKGSSRTLAVMVSCGAKTSSTGRSTLSNSRCGPRSHPKLECSPTFDRSQGTQDRRYTPGCSWRCWDSASCRGQLTRSGGQQQKGIMHWMSTRLPSF